MAQIQMLDASVGLAVEQYNAARIRLDEIRSEQRRNKRHLAIAKASYARAQRALAKRLHALYTSGSSTGLEIILGAESLSDLLARLDAVDRVSNQDARVVHDIRGFRVEVKRREAQLREAAAEQEAVVADLAAKRREIEAQLAERRQLLATIRTEIARIEEEERRRQERLQAQARERLASSGSTSSGGGGGGSGGSATAESPSASSGGGSAGPARYGGVVGIAMQYLGVPYRWGGASPSTGFDCSGFIMYVYAQVGVSLPHNAAMQYGYGSPVSRSELAPGDLVFFNGLGHAGIYIGGGQFIHSPHTGDVVKISSLGDSWYASTYVGARRL
jgi:cell wall-associated NlpC family hydrolase